MLVVVCADLTVEVICFQIGIFGNAAVFFKMAAMCCDELVHDILIYAG
jgi:hypothetical protein